MGRTYAASVQSRLTADFLNSDYSADGSLRYSLKTMRQRSRELARDNDYMVRFLRLLKTNVVGPHGIKLQARTKTLEGQPDTSMNESIETAWKDWGQVGICTMDGMQSWCDVQAAGIRALAQDGEVLVRRVRGAAAGNIYNYALQVMEADYLDEGYNVQLLSNGNRIVMGVELNSWSRPVAYWIWSSHPGTDTQSQQDRKRIRVPAEDLMHIYLMERPGQTRGVPWAHTVITRVKQLGGYEEAELFAARAGAAKMGVVTTPAGTEFVGDGVNDDGQQLMDFEPGTFHHLAEGQSVDMLDPTHPTTAFADFEKALLRGIASGLNVSYASLSNDLSDVNFSSIRHGVLDERDGYRSIQAWFVEHFHALIYREWLAMALLAGAITSERGRPYSVEREAKMRNVAWQPRGWAWVDPLKDVQANKEAVREGFKSRQDVTAETGKDYGEIVQQLAMEQQVADAAGVSLGEETETGADDGEAEEAA